MPGANAFADLENAVLPESGKILPTGGPGSLETAKGWLLAYGDTVPTDATGGYAIGCLFLHTDGGDGTALYVNEGTLASCDFNAVTVAA